LRCFFFAIRLRRFLMTEPMCTSSVGGAVGSRIPPAHQVVRAAAGWPSTEVDPRGVRRTGRTRQVGTTVHTHHRPARLILPCGGHPPDRPSAGGGQRLVSTVGQ